MFFKKAQSQIITTVLIILLVLAAIVIVWQVVNTTVKGGAEAVTDADQCFKVVMEITDVTTGAGTGSITVKRSPGTADLKKLALVIGGTRTDVDVNPSKPLDELGSQTYSGLNIAPGNDVEIYAIVGDKNHLCTSPSDTYTA